MLGSNLSVFDIKKQWQNFSNKSHRGLVWSLHYPVSFLLYLLFIVAIASTFIVAHDKIVCSDVNSLGEKYCSQYCYDKGSWIDMRNMDYDFSPTGQKAVPDVKCKSAHNDFVHFGTKNFTYM